MSFVSDFKAFVLRGNVVDLAVGVVIGAAFGKITTSLVDNVIMPPIGVLIGGVDFSQLGVTLAAPHDGKAAVIWGFGAFIQSCVDFLIIAAVVFTLIRVLNKFMPKAPPAAATPALTTDQKLLIEIRDSLKGRTAAAAASRTAAPVVKKAAAKSVRRR